MLEFQLIERHGRTLLEAQINPIQQSLLQLRDPVAAKSRYVS
jgi:hypothetical protein